MKRVLLGFVAGFIATLVFHQVVLFLLFKAGIAPNPPWPMKPVPPFGVPAVISLSFWGGVWGAIMIPIIDRRRGAAYYVIAIIFGAIAPTLVAWFIVAPLKHQPMASGFNPKRMMIGPIVNAAWGFGTALLYRLLSRVRA
jgi:hypothetical protein